MPTIREAYLLGVEHLRASGSVEPAIEAEVLLRHALRWDRTALYTRWETALESEQFTRYQGLLESRAAGRPVHYIVGEREFMGLMFAVDQRVLIPRPETEILVEHVINRFRGSPEPQTPNPEPRQLVIVDVGTGSGCIAVSLAHHLPPAHVYATDISEAALQVAKENARRHGVAERVVFLAGDLLTPLPRQLLGNIDVIAANPPYVPAGEAPMLAREIRDFEPAVAIFAPGEATSVHTRLIEQAPRWLRSGGLLTMEVGQADTVRASIIRDGRYGDVQVLPDLGGTPRVVSARTQK
ncbi:MAG TPA: peptide chain release factor N(5)-glutamine methyltransferase [bacterium]|nr:peptide chain release factor N(5)-glutamine methyltransferase [bacterium]